MTEHSSSWVRRWEERQMRRHPLDLTAYLPLALLLLALGIGGSKLIGPQPTFWALAAFFGFLWLANAASFRTPKVIDGAVRYYFPFIAHPAIRSAEERAEHMRIIAFFMMMFALSYWGR